MIKFCCIYTCWVRSCNYDNQIVDHCGIGWHNECSVNDRLSNAMYTLSHNYLQEGCINSKFLPDVNSRILHTSFNILFHFLPVLWMDDCLLKKSIIEHTYLLSNAHYFLYIDYWTDNAFSSLMTKVQLLQPLYYINVITGLLWYSHWSKVVIEVCVHEI